MVDTGNAKKPLPLLDRLSRATRPRVADTYRLNAAWLAPLAHTSLEAARRLRVYREHLADIRKHKAAHGAYAGSEADVLAQARDAESDALLMATHSTRAAQHLDASGELAAAWAHALRTQKEGFAVRGLWQELIADPAKRAVLQRAGLDDDLQGAISLTLEPLDWHGEPVAEGLRLRRPGKPGTVLVRTTGPIPGPAALLLGREFQRLVDVAATPGPGPLDLADDPTGDEIDDAIERSCTPLMATVGGTILLRQTLSRHVRKLEDTGLATHRGADPAAAFIGLMVVAVLLLVAGAAVRIACPNRRTHPGCYDVGSVLLICAGILFAVSSTTAILSVGIFGYTAWERSVERSMQTLPF